MSHVRPAHRHLANCTDRSNLIDGRAIVVVGMGGVVRPHGGPRFGGFSSMTVTGLRVTSIVVWSMDFSLHDSLLLFKLAMSPYQLVDFRLSYLIEPWLSQAVHCRQPLCRIKLQCSFQHLESFWWHFAKVSPFEGFWLSDIRELQANEPWVFIEEFLLLRYEGSENFLNAEKLVYLRFAWEKRVSICNLTHYAPNCPNIHLLAIMVTEQKFWSPVPPGCDVVGQARANPVVEHSCKPEIANF